MPSPKSAAKPKFNQPVYSWEFDAIGTKWWIGIYESVESGQLSKLQTAIYARIEKFDNTWSRFRQDSWVEKLSRRAGVYSLPPDAAPLLSYYRKLYDVTGGQVTPLVGQLLNDIGYDAEYSLKPKAPGRVPNWEDVIRVDQTSIEIIRPVLLDVGAAGKGYLVDILAQLIKSTGISSYLIDASGDMYCEGLMAPLKIGLEDPSNTEQVIGVVDLNQGALCASAPNRRRWGEYHHIMDPHKLASPQHISATWVTAKTAMLADGLSTALFFTPAAQLLKQFEFEYAILYADGRLSRSQGLAATIFSS